MKDQLRYILGNILKGLGSSGIVRSYYISSAKTFIKASYPHIRSAWVRRSLTSSDFTPLVSDVDLTVLVDINAIPELMKSGSLKPKHLVRDIQIIAVPFLNDWEETGGFRNRQIPSWIPIYQEKKLRLPVTRDRGEIAFELANEVFLLYSQLAPRLSDNFRPVIRKLGLELERLFDYWQNLDPEVLFVPRERFYSPDVFSEFTSFLTRQEKFWGELLSALPESMRNYPLEDLENVKVKSGATLFLTIGNRTVFLLKDLSMLEEAKRDFRDYFIATPNFIRLIKGCGIQEQNLLNEVAKTKEYYRRFCRQRLAHDLIGTLLQDVDNARRLYFCFKNNQEFLYSHNGTDAPGWNSLKNLEVGKIPWERNELLRYALANLEVLEALR